MNAKKTAPAVPPERHSLPQPSGSFAHQRKFRPEIQGLRALAVLLVAAYHFWFGKVSGGVDVFLLVSAFLMAGSFARKIENGQRIFGKAVLTYWLHTFKRIMPLATVTVLGVLAGTWFFFSQERWGSIVDEAKSVVLYRENWWSIANMVDYYATDSSLASPLRHFWSLSVQGQIFIIWPLLFAVSWMIYRVFKRAPHIILAVVFGTVFVVSLGYSIYLTNADQQVAYFSTWTRLWEFALGSLLAILLPYFRLPATFSAVLGWIGILAMVSCGVILDVEGKFPGYYALWPTLAAAGIILAGDSGKSWGTQRFLSLKPLLWLGKYSYGLYLIHWPVLVFYLYRVDREKAGFGAGLALLTISIFASWALTNLVEKPLRSWTWLEAKMWRSGAVIITCILLVLTVCSLWLGYITRLNQKVESQPVDNNPGAKILELGYSYQGADNPTLIPSRASGSDWADLGTQCSEMKPTWLTDPALNTHCNYTVKSEHPQRTVVAVGNSHMQVWAPALTVLAEEQNWDLIMVTKGGCFFGVEDNPQGRDYEDCMVAVDQMEQLITNINPDVVVLTGTRSEAQQPDVLLEGIENRIKELTNEGRTVIGLRDTPRLKTMHETCLASGKSEEQCAMEPGEDVTKDPQTPLETQYPGFGAVNLSDLACPDNSCPVQIGNIYVYQDYDHLTATYVKTTTDFFASRFMEALHSADTPQTKTLPPTPTLLPSPAPSSNSSPGPTVTATETPSPSASAE